jgi:hypothetical protein
MNDALRWQEKLARLRRHSGRQGAAPHKPLFLLAFLDLVEGGSIIEGVFGITPELLSRFTAYADVVSHRRDQRIRAAYPFFHLSRDGFWQILDKVGDPTDDRRLARQARVDAGFLAIAGDPAFLKAARRLIIETYFRPEDRAKLHRVTGDQSADTGIG